MSNYFVERSILIDAAPAVIWDLLVDAARWPQWKPFVRSIKAQSKLTAAATFKMRICVKGSLPAPVKAVVCDFDPPRHIAWRSGLPPVVISIHRFRLYEENGRTRLVSQEEFSGALIGLMLKIVTPADLADFHDRWLAAVKAEAERRTLHATTD